MYLKQKLFCHEFFIDLFCNTDKRKKKYIDTHSQGFSHLGNTMALQTIQMLRRYSMETQSLNTKTKSLSFVAFVHFFLRVANRTQPKVLLAKLASRQLIAPALHRKQYKSHTTRESRRNKRHNRTKSLNGGLFREN